ncbi:hypothetical protein SGFS_056020 [Streptomyces graminofaciens]|uniref:Transposase n=1 Tax=Streptomyces graminofaciens TaxID=68212 RepID=A0ABM8HLE7_9ACTN|nr:hypothetical protein SGFS_056020 [Streptomyces graminofaciens]
MRNRQITPLELLPQPLGLRAVLAYRQERLDQLPLLVGELPARHTSVLPDPAPVQDRNPKNDHNITQALARDAANRDKHYKKEKTGMKANRDLATFCEVPPAGLRDAGESRVPPRLVKMYGSQTSLRRSDSGWPPAGQPDRLGVRTTLRIPLVHSISPGPRTPLGSVHRQHSAGHTAGA